MFYVNNVYVIYSCDGKDAKISSAIASVFSVP